MARLLSIDIIHAPISFIEDVRTESSSNSPEAGASSAEHTGQCVAVGQGGYPSSPLQGAPTCFLDLARMEDGADHEECCSSPRCARSLPRSQGNVPVRPTSSASRSSWLSSASPPNP